MIVADSTGKATVTLWVTDVGLLKQHKSYQLNRLEIRYYQGKHHLSFPSAASVDEISDVEDVIEPTNSDEDNHEEQLLHITISSIRQLETIHMCVNCKKVFSINSHMGECNACSTTQKLAHPKQTTKLILESGTKILTLRAYDDMLPTPRYPKKKSWPKICYMPHNSPAPRTSSTSSQVYLINKY